MINYLISIGTILGGIFWIFNAGGNYTGGKDQGIGLMVTFILLAVGICSIIGGLKLWP